MTDEQLKINFNFDIVDFENFVYSESVESLPGQQNDEINYIFPNNTSLDNELIVLSDQG